MRYQTYFLFISFLVVMSLILPFNVPIKESLAQNFTSDIDASFLSEEDNKLYLLKGDQSMLPFSVKRIISYIF